MRADLLALTDDSLATLANRGIVKRSVREVGDGRGPAVSEAEGTVTADFPDGTTVVLPPGATIEQSRCTCPASGVCRHRVMLAIAYRVVAGRATAGGADDAAGAGLDRSWSPGSFTDEDLEAHVGSRTLAVARRTLRTGYRARVRRAAGADAVPSVELAACTVRFLVPDQLGYARVDAAPGARQDAIALAVWAFRAADEHHPGAGVADLEVGGSATPAVAGGSGVEPVLPLLTDLLADGVAGVGAGVATAVAQARRALDARNLRWPVDLLDDLADQLDAYRARSSRYHPAHAAWHVAETIARHRCVAGGGASLRVQVLGTEEAAETPLRLTRLIGLGAVVRGDDASRTIEVYLAHPEAGVVLALRRRVEVGDGEPSPTTAELGRRKAGGARLSVLASANVVTESAVRSANHVVRIADSRVARTSVAPSGGRWDDLPHGLLVRDLEAEATRLAGRPPGVVRARIVAESVRAVAVEAVEDLRYLPGAQQLQATIQAPRGAARLAFTHAAATPGAIDALARALSGEAGRVRFVAGHLRRHGGGIDLEPTAVVAGGDVVVPAFAEATGEAIPTTPPTTTEPLAQAVDAAIGVSADLVHRGHRHLPPSWVQEAQRSARQLRGVGLSTAGATLGALAHAAGSGGEGIVDRWADAHLRLLVTAEQL